MLKFKRCNTVADHVIFETFKLGFSDYFFQFDMTEAYFITHFFGAEGNSKEMSFLAYKNNEAVGILLAGIRELDGIKTLRCGAMSVIPKGRKKGIAKAMMAEHEKIAREEGVHQLFLEVLTVNESAYQLYEKIGYEKVYDLTYRFFNPSQEWFELEAQSTLEDGENFISIQKITLTDLEALRRLDQSHLPWQGSLDYVSQLEVEVYGVFKNGQLIAGLIASDKRLFYIYVAAEERLQGIGKALILTYVQDQKIESCQFIYTNNASLHTFANHLGMTTANYGQFEYYKWLE